MRGDAPSRAAAEFREAKEISIGASHCGLRESQVDKNGLYSLRKKKVIFCDLKFVPDKNDVLSSRHVVGLDPTPNYQLRCVVYLGSLHAS